MIAVILLFVFVMVALHLNFQFNSWSFIDYFIFRLLIFITNISIDENLGLLTEWLFLDGLSFGLLLLTLFLFKLTYLSRSLIINKINYTNSYRIFIVWLLLRLILRFLTNRYVLFYIIFEVRLIPTLFIIIGWGYQPERLQAGVYFIIYTLMASLPLLVSLVYLKNIELGFDIYDSLLLKYELVFSSFSNRLLGIFLILAFLVKLPVFLMHLWLPKAHVEAPVAGSIVLAGVLLKLGGYGLIRVLTKSLIYVMGITHTFVRLRLTGIILVGLVCCRLNDLKALVAYSSVSHMGLVICGILTLRVWGVNGGLVIIVSHGISSSGLFCFVNILYERTGSRSLLVNKGVIRLIPLFSLFIFVLRRANISGPPSISLLSEILLVIRLNSYEEMSIILFPLGSFLGAVFTFYIFSISQHGKNYFEAARIFGGNLLEFHVLVIHILPINILIIKNDLFFSYC